MFCVGGRSEPAMYSHTGTLTHKSLKCVFSLLFSKVSSTKVANIYYEYFKCRYVLVLFYCKCIGKGEAVHLLRKGVCVKMGAVFGGRFPTQHDDDALRHFLAEYVK